MFRHVNKTSRASMTLKNVTRTHQSTEQAPTYAPKYRNNRNIRTKVPKQQQYTHQSTETPATYAPKYRNSSNIRTKVPKQQQHTHQSTETAATYAPKYRSSSNIRTKVPKPQHWFEYLLQQRTVVCICRVHCIL